MNRNVVLTKTKFWQALLMIIAAIIAMIMVFGLANRDNGLTSKLAIPGFTQQSKIVNAPTPDPTSAPVAAPKTFKFDRSTDLKAELEKVNPEVLDTDFN